MIRNFSAKIRGEKNEKNADSGHFCFLGAALLLLSAQENKKIMNIQKAYVYLEEALLISDTDLNCSYFIRDDMPRDIRIVAKHLPTPERNEFIPISTTW